MNSPSSRERVETEVSVVDMGMMPIRDLLEQQGIDTSKPFTFAAIDGDPYSWYVEGVPLNPQENVDGR